MQGQDDPPRPGHYLREWRRARGVSLNEMARRTEFYKSTFSRIENGKVSYYREILEAYARVLGVKPYTLLHRPPGGPDGLWEFLDELIAAGRFEDLQRIDDVARVVLKQT